MKVVIDTDGLDREGKPVQLDIGYALYEDADSKEIRPCLWFETAMETVTLELSPAKAKKLIRALEFLVESAE